jgi:hypothetical protein
VGARVSVNGRDEGQTPITLRNLAVGTYTVQVASDGFVRQERRVSITAARPSQSLTFGLARAATPAARTQAAPTPATGSLQVSSRPAGARVLLDGQLVGVTPLVLAKVATGTHVVTLELEGYGPWTTSARVVGGQQNRLAASLER